MLVSTMAADMSFREFFSWLEFYRREVEAERRAAKHAQLASQAGQAARAAMTGRGSW